MSWPEKETDLARPVIAYLQDAGWTVYQEVQLARGDMRADIVAMLGSRTWVIELKRTFGLSVLDQAWLWKIHAHMVSVATPRRRKCYRISGLVLGALGIGHLVVGSPSGKNDALADLVTEQHPPRINRRPHLLNWLRDGLREEHKTFASAGNAAGKFFSPFKATCKDLAEYVVEHPGCLAKEAIESIHHHYSSPMSARCALYYWLRRGKVPGIESYQDGRRIRLRAKAKEAGA